MKKNYGFLARIICLFVLMAYWPNSIIGQNFRVKTDNFVQIDETKISWELHISRGSADLDFALWKMQIRWDYDNSVVNTGEFRNADFTITAGPEMNQPSAFWNNADLTVSTSQFQWLVSNAPADGDPITIIGEDWIKVATFTAQLSKSNLPHNFSSADLELAFQSTGAQIIVERAINTSTTYVEADGNEPISLDAAFPALGVSVNDRELAGYMFTGMGDWNVPARWNNVAVENNNTVPPGTTENVIIAGEATVTDEREVNQLTVAEGAYLKIAPSGRLKAGNTYNDNQVEEGEKDNRSAVTIAKWDFDTNSNLTADDGIEANINQALFSRVNIDGTIGSGPGTQQPGIGAWGYDGTLGYRGADFYYYTDWEGYPFISYWLLNFNTVGYEQLHLDVKVTGHGLHSYRVQWSLDGSTWNDISGGVLTLTTDGSWNIFEEIAFPNNINNTSNVYVRIHAYHPTNEEYGHTGTWEYIDDIIITGEPLPSGILVESTAAGTGSLIFDGEEVEATVQLFIPESNDTWKDSKSPTDKGWFWVSSPVVDYPIASFVGAVSETTSYDFYGWDEVGNFWRNFKDGLTDVNFVTGRGYIYAAMAANTFSFEGVVNVASNTFQGLTNTTTSGSNAGWHLIGNPYTSAISIATSTFWDNDRLHVSLTPQLYDDVNESYSTYTTAIPPMTAFFIYSAADGGQFTLDKNARVHWTESANWKDKSPANNYIILAASPTEGNTLQRSFVRLAPDAIDTYDYRYDSRFRAGLAPRFYSIKGQENLLVQGISEITEDLVIPYGFHKNNEGDHFQISILDQIDGWQLYLKDLKLDLRHKLTHDNPYVFISQANDQPMRFELHFSPVEDDDPTSIDDPTTSSGLGNAWTYDESLYVHSTEDGMQVNVFDISGRQVRSFVASTGQQAFQHALPAGIYMVRLTGQYQTKTVKVVVR